MIARLTMLWLLGVSLCSGVIPFPLKEKEGEGSFLLKPDAFAHVPMDKVRLYLDTINGAGTSCRLAPADAACAIQFLSNDMLVGHQPGPSGDGYFLRITPEVINVYAATENGRFHGLQTLAQIIAASPRAGDGTVTIACREIDDEPRFGWRGYMLDESRHFTGAEGVKRLLDAMARYKLNRLHWHLTDSPAWRIEIRKYPELTRTGGRGSETNTGPDAPAEYYTQDQIREIVSYARERHIVVVPEIDMPGHADAAVRAYPEHDGGGFQQKQDPRKWPHFTFNPASSATLSFLDDILTEVAALFPDAGVIHFGGDEVHFGWQKWPELTEVKDLMRRESIKDLAGVETWFNRRMAGKINALGFEVGGWDEIAARGLSTDKTLVFWWRHDKPGILRKALADGYPVVLCPRRPCYFDFVQHDSHKTGRRWGGFNPLEDVYGFPGSLNLSGAELKNVRGIEACLWTEVAVTQKQRDYLTWPRLVALSEAAWSAESRKDFESFRQRLKPELKWLTAKGFFIYDPFANTPEPSRSEGKPDYLDQPGK